MSALCLCAYDSGLAVVQRVDSSHGCSDAARHAVVSQPASAAVDRADVSMIDCGAFDVSHSIIQPTSGNMHSAPLPLQCDDEWDDVAALDVVLDWLCSEHEESNTTEYDEEQRSSESSRFSSLSLEESMISQFDSFDEPSTSTSTAELLLPQVHLCEQLSKEQQRSYRERSKARWLEKRRRQRAAAAYRTHYPDRQHAAKSRKRVGGKFAREGPVFMTMAERERLEAGVGALAG